MINLELPHLSHSRLQKYITCPEQYRLYYLERLRPKQEAAARVFGAVMHLALAEYFRTKRDPLATFGQEWGACQKFDLVAECTMFHSGGSISYSSLKEIAWIVQARRRGPKGFEPNKDNIEITISPPPPKDKEVNQ